MRSGPQPILPWQDPIETYHAGVNRGLLNVPCNACDKRIPVLEVCIKVSLWELEEHLAVGKQVQGGWVAREQTAAYQCHKFSVGSYACPHHPLISLLKSPLDHTGQEPSTDMAHIRLPEVVHQAHPRNKC